MKKSRLLHTTVVGLCLAAGRPQKYWYHEGKTFDEGKANRADCRADLLKRTDLR